MCDSASESGSDEEMELPNDNDEDLLSNTDHTEHKNDERGEADDEQREESSGVMLPDHTLDRKESVEIWKSRNETDVIVSDHDVFGTHENDEDSMDSLVLRDDTLDYADDSTMSSDLVTHHYDTESALSESGHPRPKRKSGSLSELSLPGSLPLKKQRPESLLCGHPSSALLETPDTGHDHESGATLVNTDHDSTELLCDTAPTSPRSPPPVSSTSSVFGSPALNNVKTLGAALMGQQGRSLIPDRENPPQDILDWVSTFSRWSHAERLLAINQLIDACEPQQVRHMMQVIEPQFQRDFISLLPKELALYTLSFLEPKDLLRAAQTCRYWRILTEDNLLWREKCREAGLGDCRDFLRKRSKISTGFIYSPWKSSFMRQHNMEMNWRIQPIRTAKVGVGNNFLNTF